MIHIIHKILAWIKNRLNYVKDIFFEFFFKKYIWFFKKKLTVFIVYDNVKSKDWRKKKIKDISNGGSDGGSVVRFLGASRFS